MHDFLTGVRVLDLSRYLPGPYATHVLAEMGAEVINIEEPGGGNPLRMVPPLVDGTSYAWQALHAGKKSVVLDLKAPGSREVMLRLAKTSHVFVETFRPGVAKRLGVDYESVRAANPDIVYCSLSAFGQTGPLRDVPGHDINFVSLAGLLGVGPLPGITVADFCGGLLAATAILGALRSGRGACIDLSLADSILSWLHLQASHVLYHGEDQPQNRALLRESFACYRTYETAEGRRLSVAALEPKFWVELCAALGRPDLSDAQFLPKEQPRVIEALAAVFRTRTLEEWTAKLAALPVAPVLNLSEALEHPQFRERGMIEEFLTPEGTRLRRVAFPPRMPGSRPPAPAPRLGEHTDEVLGLR